MGEIIDYLLIFWFVLAIVVYIVGSILEAQEQNRNKRAKQRHKRDSLQELRSTQQQANDSRYDDWSPKYNNDRYASPSHPFNESHYSASTATTSQQQQQQQPPSPLLASAWNEPPSRSFYSQQQQLQNDFLNNAYSSSPPLPSSGDPSQSNYYQDQYDNYQPTTRTPVSSIPTASGFNADCVEWVNNILYLFYTQVDKYGPIISDSVYRSLNEKLSNITSSSADYNDLMIEFDGVNRHSSTRPELTNIRTENESDRSVSVHCKIYNKQVSFNLSIRRLLNSAGAASLGGGGGGGQSREQAEAHYELILENLEGKLKSLAMLNDKLIVIQFIERPDTKILLKPRHNQGLHQHQQHQQPLINEDVLVQIILQTLSQVVVDLYFGDDVDFPRFKGPSASSTSAYSNYKHKFNTILRGSASELKKQIKHDFFGALSSSSSPSPSSGGDKERKVFIKIVRAKNINYNQNVTCLLELDSPHQQAISSTKAGSSNPYWDEHFLFTVKDSSKELLLELWDSINVAALEASSVKKPMKGSSQPPKRWNNKADLVRGAKFLGLVAVNVDELRRNPVQKVDLLLEPMETPCNLSNSVGGELQVELLFLEHSASPIPTATTTTNDDLTTAAASLPTEDRKSLRKSQSANSLGYQQGDVVSIDRKLTPSGYVITTTTITKPQQQQQQKPQKSKQQPDQLSAVQPIRNQSPISSLAEHTSLDDMNLDGVSSSHVSDVLNARHLDQRNDLTGSPADQRSEAPSCPSPGRLSRSRSRSRSFLRAIKKRFSFSRTRSRSVGESGFIDSVRSTGGDRSTGLAINADAISIESKSRASSEVSTSGMGGDGSGGGGRAKSMPASRDPNEVPTIVINKGRLSDTASAFTFTHPKSQLVIEVMEPTLREDGSGNSTRKTRARYYAIAENAPNKRKWARRGVKLHLFNEHQFVACHLAGSSTCHLCGRVFSRRPGKQGYKCRNCHLLSHKQCHVKVDHNCPYAKRDGLHLEYIDAEPPASLMEELAGGSTAGNSPVNQPQQQQQLHRQEQTRTRPMRMTAKSISMEVDDR